MSFTVGKTLKYAVSHDCSDMIKHSCINNTVKLRRSHDKIVKKTVRKLLI